LPNGYSVDLEKESFMYYSPMALMEGLFVHVGMNREGAMTKEEIKSLIESVKNCGIVTKLQAEVNALNDTIAECSKKISNLVGVIQQSPHTTEETQKALMHDIDSIERRMKEAIQNCAERNKDNDLGKYIRENYQVE
jgi:hypothetical protein